MNIHIGENKKQVLFNAGYMNRATRRKLEKLQRKHGK